MSKQQVRIAWVAMILLSLIAVVVGGIVYAHASENYYSHNSSGGQVAGILIMAGIPVVLLFGFAFIRDGQNKKQTNQPRAETSGLIEERSLNHVSIPSVTGSAEPERKAEFEKCAHCNAEFSEYRKVGEDLVCPKCGWGRAATQSSLTTKGVQDKWRPNRKLARAIGIIMIVIGAFSFYTIVGIFEIVIGVGVVKFKRQSRGNAIILMWVQVVAGSIALVVGIVFALVMGSAMISNGQSGAEYIISQFIGIAVAGFVGLVFSVPLLILLKRSSVEQVFWQSPADSTAKMLRR